MPNMCTGAFYVLDRLNNSCAIYAIYTVVSYDQIYKVICRNLTDQTVPSYESITQYVVIGRGQAGGQVFVEPPLALLGLLNTFLMDLFDRIVNL